MEPGGQLDMQQLLQAAAAVQNQLMSAQQELADTEVEGTSGGGLVTATVNGQGELLDLDIAPEVIDSGNPEETADTVADLVLAAYRDAVRAADDLQAKTMGPLAAGFGGLPGLPGLPGAGLPSDEDFDDEDDEDADADDDDADDEDTDDDHGDSDAGDRDSDRAAGPGEDRES